MFNFLVSENINSELLLDNLHYLYEIVLLASSSCLCFSAWLEHKAKCLSNAVSKPSFYDQARREQLTKQWLSIEQNAIEAERWNLIGTFLMAAVMWLQFFTPH